MTTSAGVNMKMKVSINNNEINNEINNDQWHIETTINIFVLKQQDSDNCNDNTEM